MMSGDKVEILLLTADDRFFSSLLYVTTAYGWTVRWAKSIERALEILERRAVSILVYDCCLPHSDWQAGVPRVTEVSGRTCIVLAAQQVDEDLWERALGRGAYDVMCRTDPAAQLASTLRFAWRWNVVRSLPVAPAERQPATPFA
jgi:DNA-binding response OmpR family regulator